MKVHQYFGHNFQRVSLLRHPMVLGTQQVGVEVELENIRDWNMRSDYWVLKEDGSLRNNGCEFVFRGPTGGKDLYNALCELDDFLSNGDPDGNWRCSTHMHLDVRDMDVKQLKTLILAYLVAEKALFRLSAMHRYTNNFCAAIGFAQDQLQILSGAWGSTDIGQFWQNLGGWNKYSALNLIPMHNFGSVEFRMSDAKWKKNDLLLLCNRFLALKELAMHWEGSEEELVAYMVNTPIHEVFPKGIPVDIPEDFLNEDLAVGHKLAFDLLTFHAVQAEVVREPVEMPEIRGGDGEWNNIDQGQHMAIIDFLVRAGIAPNQINEVLYDGNEELQPALQIRSHVVRRHMWSIFLQNHGQRIPNNVDLPALLPMGVMRNLVVNNYQGVIGLVRNELINHLMTQEQRDGAQQRMDMFHGGNVPRAAARPVRAGRNRANIPVPENLEAAQAPQPAANGWFVQDEVQWAPVQADVGVRDDDVVGFGDPAAEQPF